MSLPTTNGVDRIPFLNKDMPSPATLNKWDYLKDVVSQLPSYDSNILFGLVIGSMCSKALEPYKVVNSVGVGIFTYRTLLGWCIVWSSGESADQLCWWMTLQLASLHPLTSNSCPALLTPLYLTPCRPCTAQSLLNAS